MSEADTRIVAIYIGMIVLLGVLIMIVHINLRPVLTDPVSVDLLVKNRQAITYYRLSKALVKPLIKDPVEKWSNIVRITDCVELGNDVWRSVGTVVTLPGNSAKVRSDYIVYFVGDTMTPLYCKVGDVESGSEIMAISMARMTNKSL